MKGYLLSLIIFLFYLTAPLVAQVKKRGELRLMWYNVENLFFPAEDSLEGTDSISTVDPLTERDLLNPDEEFTPEGVRRWTWKRYRTKLTALARVIVAAGDWEPPEVVGLCEVEESRVLADLVQHPILKPYAYEFVHRDSPDHRGMDVACLYRKDRIEMVEWLAHSPDRQASLKGRPVGSSPGTRDILHLCFSRGKGDTLDVFMVHLVSKYGGAGASADRRRKQVDFLLQLADSVHLQRPGSLKIMSGDFNESYEGYSMEPMRRARLGGDSIQVLPLTGAKGSYKYRGGWSRIDLFLIAGSPGQYQLKGTILSIPPLLTSDEKYGGMKPFRTYEAYSYAGGVSDHLPVLLDISRSFLYPSER